MHAKTDSSDGVTSLAPSSPATGRVPSGARRPAYYVQSPSHDGETKSVSFHSSPDRSPERSPPRSLGHHSRESDSSRFSGKVNASVAAPPLWKGEAVIEEEALLDEEDGETKGIPKKCYVVGFVAAFLALFFFFAAVLWGVSHGQKPAVTVQSITFHNFFVQAGNDASNVPTDMSTLNATVKLMYRNSGSFFGVHVSSDPILIYYYQLLMASGNVKYFYQSRKSQRSLSVEVEGEKVPLYGGGSGLSITPGRGNNVPIPLTLSINMHSRAFVLGTLVNPKFDTSIKCAVFLDQTKLGKPVSLLKSCQYN